MLRAARPPSSRGPPRPCTPAARSRARIGTRRGRGGGAQAARGAGWGDRLLPGLRALLTARPPSQTAAPDGRTPRPPPWCPPRAQVPASPCRPFPREAPKKRLPRRQRGMGLSFRPRAPSPPPPRPAHPTTGLRRGARGAARTAPAPGAPCPPRCLASAMPPGRASETPRIVRTGPPSPPCLPRCPGSWPARSRRRAPPRLPSPWPLPMTSAAPRSHHCPRNATCWDLGNSQGPGAPSRPPHQPGAPVTMSPLHLCSRTRSPSPQV